MRFRSGPVYQKGAEKRARNTGASGAEAARVHMPTNLVQGFGFRFPAFRVFQRVGFLRWGFGICGSGLRAVGWQSGLHTCGVGGWGLGLGVWGVGFGAWCKAVARSNGRGAGWAKDCGMPAPMCRQRTRGQRGRTAHPKAATRATQARARTPPKSPPKPDMPRRPATLRPLNATGSERWWNRESLPA